MPRQRKTARQKPAQLQRRASASWTGGDASSKLKPPHIVAIVLSIASVAAVLFTARRTLGLDSGAGGALEDDVLPLPPFSTESRDVDPAERLARARSLLAAAVDAGAVMHVPLTIEFTGDPAAGELGLYVQDDVAAAGLPVLTLPAALMLRSAGSASDEGSSASTDENGPAGAAGLAAALLRERRRPRSKLSRLWLESLPSACPANLAARQAADAELAAVSLHAWKVGLMRAAEAEMAANLPDSSAQEREWAMCMVLSRALLHGGGSALEPVVDLINHGDAAEQRPTKAKFSPTTIVTTRRMSAGEELTFPYVDSPSRARLLTSFGFMGRDTPAASLVGADLPTDRDFTWLAEQNCTAPWRTDLHLTSATSLSDVAMRSALRCIRLRLYEPSDARFAIEYGYMDLPWGGGNHGPLLQNEHRRVWGRLLRADRLVVRNTGAMCDAATPGPELTVRLMSAASNDLEAAIRDEGHALIGCAQLLQTALGQLEKAISRAK